MSIGMVSFCSTGVQKSTFSDLINKPQVYSQKEPVATTSINDSGKKKSSLLGKIVKLGLGVAVGAGLLALGSKFKIFKPISKNGKVIQCTRKAIDGMNYCIAKMDKAGTAVGEFVKTKYEKIAPSVKKFFSSLITHKK